jgi:hypothetical protein
MIGQTDLPHPSPAPHFKIHCIHHGSYFNPLMPELNPSAQRCLTSYFTGDFAY